MQPYAPPHRSTHYCHTVTEDHDKMHSHLQPHKHDDTATQSQATSHLAGATGLGPEGPRPTGGDRSATWPPPPPVKHCVPWSWHPKRGPLVHPGLQRLLFTIPTSGADQGRGPVGCEHAFPKPLAPGSPRLPLWVPGACFDLRDGDPVRPLQPGGGLRHPPDQAAGSSRGHPCAQNGFPACELEPTTAPSPGSRFQA